MRKGIAGPLAAVLLATAGLTGVAFAEAPPTGSGKPPTAAEEAAAQKAAEAEAVALEKSLTPVKGKVHIPEAKATLNLGDDYYFLPAADARKVLTAWGNPPSAVEGVLGMIFPKQFSPMQAGAWGAVVSFEDTGYVKDDDARTADYNAILKSSQENAEATNEQRKAGGFQTVNVVGWAEPPAYNAGHHVVIWARDLQFGGDPTHTLNYDIRVLGRRGVLSLNVVAGMPDLQAVHAAAASVEQTAVFDAGERYTDFKPGLDKAAGYGIAGLVAGGLGVAAAKKIGLIGIILLFAKKGFAIILAALAGVGAWFRKMFGGGGKDGGGKGKPPKSGPTDFGPPPASGGGGDIVT